MIHLPQGQRSFIHDNIFLGQLPKRIVLGLVDNRTFNGDISLNPYNIAIKFFSGSLGRTTSSVGPLQPSFSDRVISVPSTPNLLGGGAEYLVTLGTQLDENSFVNGHAPYCFDLTPDLSSSCGHHFSVTKTGNLRLELGFEVVL